MKNITFKRVNPVESFVKTRLRRLNDLLVKINSCIDDINKGGFKEGFELKFEEFSCSNRPEYGSDSYGLFLEDKSSGVSRQILFDGSVDIGFNFYYYKECNSTIKSESINLGDLQINKGILSHLRSLIDVFYSGMSKIDASLQEFLFESFLPKPEVDLFSLNYSRVFLFTLTKVVLSFDNLSNNDVFLIINLKKDFSIDSFTLNDLDNYHKVDIEDERYYFSLFVEEVDNYLNCYSIFKE